MKVKFLILIIFSLPIISYGQTNKIVKSIFYNLPLDASSKEIKNRLISDKRFISTDTTADSSFFSENTFIGLRNSKGLVKVIPDSVEVELTYGYSFNPEKKNHKSSNDLFLKSRYYYFSKDSAEKAYYDMVNLMRPLTKDTLVAGIDTIVSESPIRSQLKAKGIEFIFHKPYYKVTVLCASITKSYFGLFIEYTRRED